MIVSSVSIIIIIIISSSSSSIIIIMFIVIIGTISYYARDCFKFVLLSLLILLEGGPPTRLLAPPWGRRAKAREKMSTPN